MSSIGFNINLLTTVPQFQKMAFEAIRDELNKKIPLAVPDIKDKIQNNIKKIFTVSPEYNALVSGPLDAHFGIPKGEAIPRLDAIINKMADSVDVSFRRIAVRGNSFTGGLDIKAIFADFIDLINMREGHVDIDGGSIPWLEWLLMRGDSFIVYRYGIKFGNYGQSRSGAAIMVRDDTAVWKVPVGVSGTLRDNWITRAVDSSMKYLEALIDGAVQDSFNKVF